jgi:DNA topoisomerase VI subunit A
MLWAAETLPRLDGLFTPQKLLTRINIIMKCIDEQRLARSKSLVIPYLTENGSEVDATREPIAYPLDQTAHFLRGLRDFQVMLHERIQAEADGIDEETTKRELAYQLVDILGEKGASELMALIARHLGIPYRSMRIAAEQIGTIAGRLWVRFGNEFVDCTKLLLQPGGIPTFAMLGNIILGASQPRHQLQFYTDAQLMLVVGDGGIFQRIVRARLCDKIPMIILCTHGNMRHDTNVNLFCISKAFGIPVFVLDGE